MGEGCKGAGSEYQKVPLNIDRDYKTERAESRVERSETASGERSRKGCSLVGSRVKEGEEDTGCKVGDDRRRTATGLGIKGRPELRGAQSILGSPSENNPSSGAKCTSKEVETITSNCKN